MAEIVHAYDRLYLGDICRSQGGLFAHLAGDGVDMIKLIPAFMTSKTRKDMDIAWLRWHL